MPDSKDLGLANDKIVSVVRTSGTGAPGTTDTYTITLRSGSTYNFTVRNGTAGGGVSLAKTGTTTLNGLRSWLASNNLTFEKVVKVFAAWTNGTDTILADVVVSMPNITGYSNDVGKVVDPSNSNLVDADTFVQNMSAEYWIVFYGEADMAAYVPESRTIADLSLENDIDENVLFDKMNIKGRYATLSDLQTAEPNHGYCYLVEENNHWYYWNGSAWTDGGAYLSGAFDNELNEKSTNAVQNKVVAKNIIDLSNRYYAFLKIRKQYVYPDTGEIIDYVSDSNPYCRTDYIDVSEFDYLTIENPTQQSSYNCWYDENKNFVANLPLLIGTNNVSIPPNAKYFILSNAESAFDNIKIVGYTKQNYDHLKNIDNYLGRRTNLISSVENNFYKNVFVVGRTYAITNTSPNSIRIAMGTTDTYNSYVDDIETVTPNLGTGETVDFTPTISAKYIRFYVTSVGGTCSIIEKNETKVEYRLEQLEKNQYQNPYADRPANGYENFSVNVNCHEYTDNDEDGESIYTDYGVIALPSSYTKNGTPTKLLILCGGTGERIGSSTNPLSFHGWSYFLAKGYAVLDMNGMPSGWGTAKSFPVTNQHYCNKFLLGSYAKGYEYAIKKYNLDKRVFIAGISMGGGASALIVQSRILPVIAHACFCPALSVYKQDYMNPWGGENQQRTIAGQWGFTNWATETPSQQYFLDNIEKIKGFDNLLINTIGDKAQANANYGNQAEEDAYNSLSKIYPVPLKIWHCEDDTTVLARYSHFMVNMIKNAGGQAWLRTFETGGHLGGWETGEVNDDGVTTSIPFYEARLFFERFK